MLFSLSVGLSSEMSPGLLAGQLPTVSAFPWARGADPEWRHPKCWESAREEEKVWGDLCGVREIRDLSKGTPWSSKAALEACPSPARGGMHLQCAFPGPSETDGEIFHDCLTSHSPLQH